MMIMDERKPVLQAECQEFGKKVIRSVRLAHLSVERIQFLWDKMKNYDILFDDFIGKNFEEFLKHFVVEVDGQVQSAGLIWDVDDVGVFTLNNIIPEHSGKIHYVFWDEKFRGREDLCRAMMKYAMEKYDLHKLWTEIPVIARSALQAADRVGLVREGRKRQAAKYKGVWVDMNVYGLLKEDFDVKIVGDNPPVRTVCYKCGDTYNKHHTPRPRIGVQDGPRS
jgi:RimJ/RimL family protein N-acetyltransferase